jgi:hypothetical protein
MVQAIRAGCWQPVRYSITAIPPKPRSRNSRSIGIPSVFDTVARLQGHGKRRASAGAVELAEGDGTAGSLGVAEQVECDTFGDVRLGADLVDGFLHLAMASVSALDGVGGGRQQSIIQEGERLLDIGGEERLPGLAHGGEALHPPAQASQLVEGCLGPAATVEQPIDFIHDLAQRPQLRQAARDPLQSVSFAEPQMALDEWVAVGKQIAELLF